MPTRSSGATSRSRRQLLAGMLGLAAGCARAQGRVARLVVGFGPGGTSDLAARAVSGSLRDAMGGEVIVENRPGAGGQLAIEHVRGAAPDGSVALLVPDAVMFLYPHVYRHLRYDPERDFVPVARVANLAIGLYVGPMVPASVLTVADFVQWVRADDRRAVFGTSAAGATPHFVGEMFARAAGLSMTAVHYRGGAPGIQDLAGGQLPAMFGAVPDGSVMQSAGRVRALATTGPRRSAATPDVPTFAEQSFGDLVVEDGLGVYLPAGATSSTVERMALAMLRSLDSAEARRVFESIGLDKGYEGPEAFAQRLRRERARWAGIIRSTGFKALDER
ncbi:tripartite tricarboxylate transporter substrate-binding protein [Variovorax sp. YR752]|uniref:tripartite tricarboxylate transporter substrate-binding protein n=1 Tax=Variovorax sp. YR752 TaxID=1884383 RepID=UPI003137E043